MFDIKCKGCGKTVSVIEPYFKFEGEKGFYCESCYKKQYEEREKELIFDRIKMFFEMFIFLTLAVLVMCTVLLFIPMFGIWLGVPEWGGLIYALFILIVGASISYAVGG